jgi:hypothetical protein
MLYCLSQKPEVEEVSDLPRFAVVGRPNAENQVLSML